jgi:hypothetical protein
METGLQLLMRDGAARIVFQPRLSAEQYAELLALAESCATRADLESAVKRAGQHWGKQVDFEELGV